jgi:hypothetical protein
MIELSLPLMVQHPSSCAIFLQTKNGECKEEEAKLERSGGQKVRDYFDIQDIEVLE